MEKPRGNTEKWEFLGLELPGFGSFWDVFWAGKLRKFLGFFEAPEFGFFSGMKLGRAEGSVGAAFPPKKKIDFPGIPGPGKIYISFKSHIFHLLISLEFFALKSDFFWPSNPIFRLKI